MTAKFEAFKAALHALCIEHGVRLDDDGDHDYRDIQVSEASEGNPAGLHFEISDCVPETPEEKAEREARFQRWAEQAATRAAEFRAAEERRLAGLNTDADYQRFLRIAQADAIEQRTNCMRVTTDPTDPHYSAAPRRVWCQDVEIADWTVADEFRRVVITADGKVHNGAVRVERLECDKPAPTPAPAVAEPEGFVQVFEHIPEAPAATPAPSPEPAVDAKTNAEALPKFTFAADAFPALPCEPRAEAPDSPHE
jgi:hypothetical protein